MQFLILIILMAFFINLLLEGDSGSPGWIDWFIGLPFLIPVWLTTGLLEFGLKALGLPIDRRREEVTWLGVREDPIIFNLNLFLWAIVGIVVGSAIVSPYVTIMNNPTCGFWLLSDLFFVTGATCGNETLIQLREILSERFRGSQN